MTQEERTRRLHAARRRASAEAKEPPPWGSYTRRVWYLGSKIEVWAVGRFPTGRRFEYMGRFYPTVAAALDAVERLLDNNTRSSIEAELLAVTRPDAGDVERVVTELSPTPMVAAAWAIGRAVVDKRPDLGRDLLQVHPVSEACGHYACIWPAGRSVVLKLTYDPNDIRVLALATRRRWPGFARVRYAFSLGTRFGGYWPDSPAVVSPLPLWGALITRYGEMYDIDNFREQQLAVGLVDTVQDGGGYEELVSSLRGSVLTPEDREDEAGGMLNMDPDDIDETFPEEYLTREALGPVLRGLGRMHKAGLPLPDLHTGNIKMGRSGQVVVIDAGVWSLTERVPFPGRFNKRRFLRAMGRRV
jgi:hypothetical protein